MGPRSSICSQGSSANFPDPFRAWRPSGRDLLERRWPGMTVVAAETAPPINRFRTRGVEFGFEPRGQFLLFAQRCPHCFEFLSLRLQKLHNLLERRPRSRAHRRIAGIRLDGFTRVRRSFGFQLRACRWLRLYRFARAAILAPHRDTQRGKEHTGNQFPNPSIGKQSSHEGSFHFDLTGLAPPANWSARRRLPFLPALREGFYFLDFLSPKIKIPPPGCFRRWDSRIARYDSRVLASRRQKTHTYSRYNRGKPAWSSGRRKS